MTTQQDASNFKQQDTQPWYKNYMVIIFVIGMPLFVVVACIWFVFYSFEIEDSVVRDDWYMDGKTLYQDASRDKLTHDLDLRGDMLFAGNEVTFYLNYPQSSLDTGTLENGAPLRYPDKLSVSISHATHIDKDRSLILHHVAGNKYVGQVDDLDPLLSKYYIEVTNDFAPVIHNADLREAQDNAQATAQPNSEPQSSELQNWRMRQVTQLPNSKVHFEPLKSFD